MDRDKFLANHQLYHLGMLPTEQPHPKTEGLSDLVQEDLSAAIDCLKSVDGDAIKTMGKYASGIEEMRKDVLRVLSGGGRIFLCGCGATGRLSLLLEFLWKEKFNTDQVIGFMAGGDVALVHSLEGFEDYPERGAKHLVQMGFSENDLLIASTEGGETPYVIGATLEASKISKEKPWFLFCNPKEILVENIERSCSVLENDEIRSLCLFTGSMSLSGSTRMQASTVLQMAIGMALLEVDLPVLDLIKEFQRDFESFDFKKLAPFIDKEFNIYQSGEYLMYMPRHFGISVFTDTTERSPTFSLPSFENDSYRGEFPSLCYILIPHADSAGKAWLELIKRPPHALNWIDIDPRTGIEYIDSFDFSKLSMEKREERLGLARQYIFEIDLKGRELLFSLNGVEGQWSFETQRSLFRHTIVKLMLNTHSTLLMGKMGRYYSNIMTWVKPTNAKLVDRSARYVEYLLGEIQQKEDYLKIVNCIYDIQPRLSAKSSIVLEVFNHLKKEKLHPEEMSDES